jgi:hypothetical protein
VPFSADYRLPFSEFGQPARKVLVFEYVRETCGF